MFYESIVVGGVVVVNNIFNTFHTFE